MSLRLTFLYPHLFRPIVTNAAPAARTSTRRVRRSGRSPFTTTSRVPGQRFVQRHGKAVEPYLAAGETVEGTKVYVAEDESREPESEAVKVVNDKNTQGKDNGQMEVNEKGPEDETSRTEPSSSAPLSEETQAAEWVPGDAAPKPIVESGTYETQTPLQKAAENTMDGETPLDTVLHMEAPAASPEETGESEGDGAKLHMQTPPYVHHFDTFTLVKEVEAGGFTLPQSVTAMKAVRGLLALNLDVAKEGLVSKSDVENVGDPLSSSFVLIIHEP